MDPFPQQQRLAALRQKLAALTTEVVKTEEELTNLETDEQLNLGATPASAVQIPLPRQKRSPCSWICLAPGVRSSRRI